MSTFAETLSPEVRRRGRILAFCACCFGCISEVMLDSSAIIILYISMLGGSKQEVMFSTGFSAIFCMAALIPCAFLIGRIGMRRAVTAACLTGCAGYLLMAAAPFFGPFQKIAVLSGCFIYCAQRSLYGAAWYPMLDVFLRPQDRGSFFGTMRTTYMILSGVLFYLVGKLMGKDPPVVLMQIVIGVTGLLILGRMFCMLHFPENPNAKRSRLDIKSSLGIAVRNGPLVNFSVYVCLVSMACTSLVPLTLLYLKNHVGMDAGSVQIFSTVGIAGSIAGYFCYGYLQRKLKVKRLELAVHLLLALSALALALLPKGTAGFAYLAGTVYFFISFANSTFMCNNSTEMLALARPGNKTMAMAFQQTYHNLGISIGRAGTGLILGANLLMPTWTCGSLEICSYQTLFLLYGALLAVLLVLIPALPAVVPKHHDYYEP